jgi:hypothetical protein
MLRREGHIGEHVGLGLIQEASELGLFGTELVGDLALTRKEPRGETARLFRTSFGSLVVSEIALLLRLCGDERVSTLLRVLRRLFIVD